MHDFAYHRPASVADAVKALSAAADGKLVAGGMTLVPTMKQRLAAPSDLIDLGGIAELKGIKAEGGGLVIGALTTHAEVARSSLVKQTIPALAALADGIGDPAVRNRGTIGGSVANNDPAADYPAGLVGLDATIQTNKRKIKADDFFMGMFSTALQDGEIITAVSFPIPEKAGWQKFKQPASRFSMVGVFVSKGPAGVRVAVTGAGASGVFRAKDLEAKLASNWSAGALAGATVAASGLNSDLHASAEYRAALIPVLAKRAVG